MEREESYCYFSAKLKQQLEQALTCVKITRMYTLFIASNKIEVRFVIMCNVIRAFQYPIPSASVIVISTKRKVFLAHEEIFRVISLLSSLQYLSLVLITARGFFSRAT